jgi:uncharacterized protein involved in exopolysaccharide biosynthesis
MNDLATPRGHSAGARDFLAVLFRRRWVIGSIFAVTTLTVLAINLSQPLYYESTGRVIIKRGVRDSMLQPFTRMMSWEEELASEVETAKSGKVVNRAQDIVDATRKAAGRPTVRIDARRVDASVVGESNVVAMSYQDRDPEIAVEVTDAVLQAYMDYRRSEFTLQYPKEFFDTEITRVTTELNDWTRRREEYLSSTGTSDLKTEAVHNATFVTGMQGVLAEVERNIAESRASLESMKSYLASGDDVDKLPYLANVNSGNDNVITELKRKLVEARVRYRSMEQVYVPQSRELTQERERIENLETMLGAEIKSRVQVAETELRGLEARRAQTVASMSETRSRMASYPTREARLSEIETKIAGLQKNYEDLTEASARAKISKATSPDLTVDLLNPAGKAYPKNQRDYVRLALAPIFSLIVGLGLAFFLDGLDATLKSPREAEEALELPVLASLTEQKRRRA